MSKVQNQNPTKTPAKQPTKIKDNTAGRQQVVKI
jgi:hypothetical protein